MAAPTLEQDKLILENFSPEHTEAVSKLLLKFTVSLEGKDNSDNELGLVFNSRTDVGVIDPVVDSVFEEHPELEDSRREMDQKWWDGFSEETKKEYEGDEEFFESRKKVSRFRVVLASPFSEEIRNAEIQHHLEKSTAQHRAVVSSQNEVLGYLAVWSGPSTLYLDDHMQVDAKVADPDLSPEDQGLVVAKFEPILYDLSLP